MEQKKKAMKSFRFLFVLAFAFAMTMFMTSAAFADTEVSDWNGLQTALGNGGTVKLVQDIAAEADSPALTVSGGVATTLDLNGHTIDRSNPNDTEETKAKTSPVITVSGGDLTLTDSGTNGKITGANTGEAFGSAKTYGGGVVLESGSFTMQGGEISSNRSAESGGGGVLVKGGTFTMEGGKIISNIVGPSTSGGGVLVESGSFTMTGGKISGTTATSGGGVALIGDASSSKGSTLTMDGSVEITNNKIGTDDNAPANNVYLSTAFDKITLNGALTNSTIGVTMNTSGIFTSSNVVNASEYAGCFFSDRVKWAVQAEGNELKLAEADCYPVWVGKTQVTKDNKNDILGDGGKAKYDPAANTLTLDNPTIKDFYSGPNAPHASIYAKQYNLKIEGSASLTNPDKSSNGSGIYVSGCNVELDGNFIIKATYYGIGASAGDVTISGGNVNVTSDAGIQGSIIEIKGGTLTSAARHSGLQALDEIILGDGMQIVRPAGGQIGGDEYNKWINDADGNRANVVVISSDTTLTLVTFVDGQGNILKADAVKPGEAATAPADPTREGYTFDGWDKDFSKVTEDLTVTAKWKENTTPTPDPKPTAPVSIKNAKVVLSASAFAYNGKVRKPAIKKIGGKALKAGTDYTAKWSNKSSKNVGAYTVTITGKGNYTGVTKATYKINPKGTSLKKLKKAKKAVTVKWKKQKTKMSKARITGYQIQLATDKKFTKNKKTVTVKGYKKVSKKVTKLKGGKKYYVKIRTYKTIKGKKYYSKWSKVKTIKTKK